MARKLVVEAVADTRQFVQSMKVASTATTQFAAGVDKVAVSSEVAAKAQVAAAVKTTESVQLQVAEYKRLAAAAEVGSREQIAAANLAAQAERKLAASLGVAAAEAQNLQRHSGVLGSDIGKAERGALAGSGIFHSFGRSLAFASGGFLAFEGASAFLRGSINAAREAGVAQRSLAAQMKAAGESFQANRTEIEKVSLSYGKFGFQNDEVVASLTVLERGTGKISEAFRLQGLAADIARAKGIHLTDAANVIAKVFGHQETALRRAVPGLEKNAHGWDLIRLAQAKMAGQAAAATTSSERFAAILHDTEEIVGTALLPTLNKYLDALGKWLQKMNESGKLQKDVTAVTDTLRDALNAVKDVLHVLNSITGSTTKTLRYLFGVFVAFKALEFAAYVQKTATAFGLMGTKAAEAAVEVDAVTAAQRRQQAQAAGFLPRGGLIGGIGIAAAATFGAVPDTLQGKRAADVLRRSGKAVPGRPGVFQIGGKFYAATDQGVVEVPADAAGPRGLGPDDRGGIRGVGALPSTGGAAGGPRATSLQGRFNIQELKLAQAQLTARLDDDRKILVVEEAIVRKQIEQSKTLKERTALTNTLAGIVGQVRDIDTQGADALKAQAQARKDAAKAAADAAKAAKAAAKERQTTRLQTGLDWLDFGLEKAQATPGIKDNIEAEKKIIAGLKEMARLTGMTVDTARQIWEHRQALNDLLKQKQKVQQQAGANGPWKDVWTQFTPGGPKFFGDVESDPAALAEMRRLGVSGVMSPRQLPRALQLPVGGEAAKTTLTINGGLHLHGIQNVAQLEQDLQKRAGQRQQPRRGKR